MGLQRRRECVKPVNIADKIFEGFAREHVFDTQRQDRDAVVDRTFNLAANLPRGVRFMRENEDHDPTFFNGVNNTFAPFHAGSDVTGGNPAADAARFEHGANCISRRLIFGGVADKNVVGHTCVAPGLRNLKVAEFYTNWV